MDSTGHKSHPMKFAILSDIHANLEAFDAVLEDAAAQGATDYLCLGDIVGYNANPHECIERLRALGCPVVKGNHDEEASAETDISGLNPVAQSVLDWTRRALSAEDKAWLQALPLIRQVRDFTIVHSTLDTPSGWAYVMNKFDAMASFSCQFTQLCFFGHTHMPKVYTMDASRVTEEKADLLRIEADRKYFINVGSVGQPRNGDWRSTYALYDEENQRVTLRRIPYNVALTRLKNRAAGLPDNGLGVGGHDE
jgi:predicted phosphodiesterase